MDESSRYSSPVTARLAALLSGAPRTARGVGERFGAILLQDQAHEIIPEDMRPMLAGLRTAIEESRSTMGDRALRYACNDYLGPDRRRAPTYRYLVAILGEPESTPWAGVRPSDSRADAFVRAVRALLGFERKLARDVSEKIASLHGRAEELGPGRRDMYLDSVAHLTPEALSALPLADLVAWRRCLVNEAVALGIELAKAKKERL